MDNCEINTLSRFNAMDHLHLYLLSAYWYLYPLLHPSFAVVFHSPLSSCVPGVFPCFCITWPPSTCTPAPHQLHTKYKCSLAIVLCQIIYFTIPAIFLSCYPALFCFFILACLFGFSLLSLPLFSHCTNRFYFASPACELCLGVHSLTELWQILLMALI